MTQQTRPKPSHHSSEYGAWFKDPLVAEAYPTRPPYPEDVISLLVSLLAPPSGGQAAVLDLGAGTGDLARRLVAREGHVARVDAVDASEPMVSIGKQLPGGDHPHLRWILSTAEDAPLDPPYALATAGESLHWMEWEVVLPRVADALAPGAVLAIVNRNWDGPPALRDRMIPIFERHSPVPDYKPYDMIAELTSRGLFVELGRQRCGPSPWTPTVAEYVECRHSQRGGSRTHMGPEIAASFDEAVVRALEDSCRDGTIQEISGRLQLQVVANVVWGTPTHPPQRGTA